MAMVVCVVAEMRAFLALLRVPPRWGPGGPFNLLWYMDDPTWCINSESDLLVFTDNLQKAGLLTNLFSSRPKHLSVVAANEGFQVTFHPRSHARASGLGYVGVVGRHMSPDVYHKVDKMKLLRASRPASRALAMVRLPSNYPDQMHGAVTCVQQR